MSLAHEHAPVQTSEKVFPFDDINNTIVTVEYTFKTVQGTKTLFINTIDVSPRESRGNKFGGQAIDKMIAFARQSGARRITAADVNGDAVPFWVAKGFARTTGPLGRIDYTRRI